MEPRPTYTRSNRSRRLRFNAFLILMLLLAAGGYLVFGKLMGQTNDSRIDYPFSHDVKPLFYKGEELEHGGLGEGEALKLPYPVLKEWFDPSLYYEADSGSVILTTEDKVVRFQTSQLTAVMNEKPYKLQFPAIQEDDIVYVPIAPLQELYQLEIRESSETGAVILHKAGDILLWGEAAVDPKHPERSRKVRSGPSVKDPIYADVAPHERVMLWGEEASWYRVQTSHGVVGYMAKEDLILLEPETIPERSPAKPLSVPWKPLGGKINLTWQQVYNKNPDPTKFPPMPGLNVISPQWFILADGQGTIEQKVDPSFVKWAHEKDLQVWALFHNGFDPKRTTEALSTYDRRMKMIRQLVSYAQMYNIQGINIDFENVYLKDKEAFVQFVRELTPFLHELGLVVSVDVTIKGGSANYSLFLDRKALGETVDYMMVMTYDEHWATSPKAGSVASLPWVENGIVRIMEEDGVPPSKLLLGVPFYTRIWTETVKNGTTTVSSKAVGMESIEKLLEERKLTPVMDPASGQHYVEYKENASTTIKIWIEDETSMKKRIELVKKYDLAGVASWSRGQEKASVIWSLIKETLEARP